ncbi:MAG TPA: EAL domain-containing protein [Vicinamibacteria bacterium]|nr:EAL domain-containing protein [Vicinamibacteria bacterium]
MSEPAPPEPTPDPPNDNHGQVIETVSLLQSTLESTADGILVMDPLGRILAYNQRFVALWQIPQELLLARDDAGILAFTLEQVCEPDLCAERVRELYASPDAEAVDVLELRDGRVFERYSLPQRLDGRVVGRVWSYRDITDRRRAEEALRRSEERYREILASISEGYYEVDLGGDFVFVNDALCDLLGYSQGELLGMNNRQYTDPANARKLYQGFHSVYLTGNPASFLDWEILRKDGTPRVVEASVALLRDPAGEPVGFRGVVRDVTEQKRAEQALRESEERYRRLIELSPDAVAIYSEGRIVFCSPAGARLVGYDRPQELLGKPIFEIVHPDSRPLVEERIRRLLTAGQPLPFVEEKFLHRSGATLDVEVGAVPFTYQDRPAVQVVVRDISERKRAEKLQSALFRIAQATSSLTDMASFYAEIHGILAELMYARNLYIALYDRAKDTLSFPYFADQHDPTPAPRRPGRGLTEYVLRSGEPLLACPATVARLKEQGEIELIGSPSVDWMGAPLKRDDRCFGVLAVQTYQEAFRFTASDRDLLTFVSQHVATAIARKQAEEQIRSLAYHDVLTGLPNRLLFQDRLAVAVANAHRRRHKLAVLFFDLDRFKLINDSLGHSLGDRLLQAVAERLGGSIREGDTVARLGGDEFTVLLPELGRNSDAAKVSGKILEALRLPFVLGGRELYVTASVGVAIYPHDGHDAETLVKNADTAMYRAKEHGRDNYQLYTATMNASAVERLALENALRKAVAGRSFEVHYQPQLDFRAGRVYGVEALVRWRHPERGLLAPSEFIGLAELTGLIVPLGLWVLETACAQAKAWQAGGRSDLKVGVNLSARQLQAADVIEQVRRVLRETGLAPQFLDLEITETNAMQNADATIAILRELKALGVSISIDDFGIGYSSLNYLKRLPIDTLKIDQSFVRDVTTDPDDAAIASAIIGLAQTLKLAVVAEGVETREQLAFLVSRGCHRMQGRLFSDALPAEACQAFLAREHQASGQE